MLSFTATATKPTRLVSSTCKNGETKRSLSLLRSETERQAAAGRIGGKGSARRANGDGRRRLGYNNNGWISQRRARKEGRQRGAERNTVRAVRRGVHSGETYNILLPSRRVSWSVFHLRLLFCKKSLYSRMTHRTSIYVLIYMHFLESPSNLV